MENYNHKSANCDISNSFSGALTRIEWSDDYCNLLNPAAILVGYYIKKGGTVPPFAFRFFFGITFLPRIPELLLSMRDRPSYNLH